MKCPHCVEKNLKSSIQKADAGHTTALSCPPYYDEEGKYHYHDSNVETSNYQCSNGHRFTKKRTGSCWCGWGKKLTEKKRPVFEITKEIPVPQRIDWNCRKCDARKHHIIMNSDSLEQDKAALYECLTCLNKLRLGHGFFPLLRVSAIQ